MAVVGTVSRCLQIALLSGMSEGISEDAAAANDARQAIISVLQLLIILATAGAFVPWLYRVHKNLSSLGARKLDCTSGWAVGLFFIPILNLFRPFQVMREV